MHQSNIWTSQGDRFISSRSLNDDAAYKYGAKVELFSSLQDKKDIDDEGNAEPQNQTQRQDSSIIEEENKKMYTALLQNQVLGIDNPYLLHEIHNSDESHQKYNLYSQMQRQTHPEEAIQIQSEARKSALLSGCALSNDSTPFNSKFNVLKFNSSSKSSIKHNQGMFYHSNYTPNGLFTNASNFSSSQQSSEILSQTSQSSTLSGLSENSNPLFTNYTAFKSNPLAGFDEDQVIVPKNRSRKISKIPYKVLDAPALQDDFYLNLVDWSPYNNLAVGLSSCIYIWSASSGKVTKLSDLGPRDSVTSVCWSKRGQHLSVGTNSGVVQVWDVNKCKLLRVMKGHEGRVGAIAWNSSVLSSGSKDKRILSRDLREKDDYFGCLQQHKQEVCGLKWSYDEQQLASGGNDNKLFVWSAHNNTEPAGKFHSHLAAVKAISWSPHQHGLLASGGGTADRCIRFWNTNLMQEINSIETGSQVCNLLFSKNENEIVSTHGYSDNAIIVWKYPSMKKVATLTGHTLRVLYLAMSPDGESIVTGAGDETLRFWKVFPPLKSQKEKEISIIDPQNFNIR